MDFPPGVVHSLTLVIPSISVGPLHVGGLYQPDILPMSFKLDFPDTIRYFAVQLYISLSKQRVSLV